MLINDSQNPCFPVEQELRDLAQSCMSLLSIAALYDTSREKLELFGGFSPYGLTSGGLEI